MTLDRWRGRGGVMGWFTAKWDVWQIRRFVRRAKRLHAAEQARLEKMAGL